MKNDHLGVSYILCGLMADLKNGKVHRIQRHNMTITLIQFTFFFMKSHRLASHQNYPKVLKYWDT